MNTSEILGKLIRTGRNEFEINVFCKFFAENIRVLIFSGDSDDNNIVISDYLAHCIRDIIDSGTDEKSRIIGDIFSDYENAVRTTDYGMVPDELRRKFNGNIEMANREYFQITSEEEA